MARVVDKNVRLAGRQYGREMRFRTATYSLEVPMNDIAGVEVAEALGDVGKLATGVSVR
jgi:hypothetical protein